MNEVLSGPGSHACTSVVRMSDRGGVTGLWSLAGHACRGGPGPLGYPKWTVVLMSGPLAFDGPPARCLARWPMVHR